jgi:transcriptional regulator with XRE-family HTH domain
MIAPDNAFRQWRKRLGLSQAALAQKLGYDSRTIRAFETGEKNPRPIVLVAMAAIEAGLSTIVLKDAA